MKKVLIISSSPRADGNSESLAKEFYQGASDSGNEVELVALRSYNFGYCHGCYACNETGRCYQLDGFNDLAEKVLNCDVLVLATPVYFYSMSGQLKVFIDRLVPIYTKIRAEIYIICTAWDTDEKLINKCVDAIRGCTKECFERCEEKGVLAVGGVVNKGDIENKKDALNKAYDLGFKC